MKENLLKISASLLLASALVGCGGSSSSSKKPKPVDPTPPVDVKNCTYTTVVDTLNLKVGAKFTTDLIKVTILDGKKKDISATKKFVDADKVDTKKEGNYNVTITSDSCKTKKVVAVKVTKPSPTDGESQDPLASPF